jgi:hypothetical protein
MCRAYQDLCVPPEATNLMVLRVAIRRLHSDTLAVRSWRAARKRYYRDLINAHHAAQDQPNVQPD